LAGLLASSIALFVVAIAGRRKPPDEG
jgi:hypothetical protein